MIYQSEYADNGAFLIDLGSNAEVGLSGFNSGTLYASDGIHPLVYR